MPTKRMTMGAVGEAIAARFLERRGLVVDRNVRVGRDEIDLLVRDDAELIAIEVKTRMGRASRPWEAFDDAKRTRVGTAGRSLSARRVDLVAVQLHEEGATVRWLPLVG